VSNSKDAPPTGYQPRNRPRREECQRFCFRDGGTCLFHEQTEKDIFILDKNLRSFRLAVWSLALSMLPLSALVSGFLIKISNTVAVLAKTAEYDITEMRLVRKAIENHKAQHSEGSFLPSRDAMKKEPRLEP
jgi:hypothetical protein